MREVHGSPTEDDSGDGEETDELGKKTNLHSQGVENSPHVCPGRVSNPGRSGDGPEPD